MFDKGKSVKNININNINLNKYRKFKMGPRNSKESQLSFMKDYEIVQQNPI